MAEDQSYEKFLQYAFVITPYASVIALLYLWGYWGSYKINIFSFISLADILKLALVPLVLILLITGLTAIILYFTTTIIEKGKKREPVSPRFSFILNCAMVITALVLFIFMTNVDKWLWAGLLIGSVLARILDNLEVSKRLVSDANLRLCIALLVALPLFSAFGVGKRNAQSILDGDDKSRLVETKLFREYGGEAFSKKHLLEGQEKLKYLGVAGDYLFFLSLDNSKSYIVKFSDVHFLEFNQY